MTDLPPEPLEWNWDFKPNWRSTKWLHWLGQHSPTARFFGKCWCQRKVGKR